MGDVNTHETPSADPHQPPDAVDRSRGFWLSACLLLAIIHFVYAFVVGFLIYRQRSDFTWVNVAWLAGSPLFQFGRLIGPSPEIVAGLLLLACGSGAAGFATMRAARAATSGGNLGRKRGKTWLAILLWVLWVPVSFKMTFFYWFEAY